MICFASLLCARMIFQVAFIEKSHSARERRSGLPRLFSHMSSIALPESAVTLEVATAFPVNLTGDSTAIMGSARPAAKPAVPTDAETESACHSCMAGGASRSAGLATSMHTSIVEDEDRASSRKLSGEVNGTRIQCSKTEMTGK